MKPTIFLLLCLAGFSFKTEANPMLYHPISPYLIRPNLSNAIPSAPIWFDCIGTIPNLETSFTTCKWMMVPSHGSDCPIPRPAKCSPDKIFCPYLLKKKDKFVLSPACFFPHPMDPPFEMPEITCTDLKNMDVMFNTFVIRGLIALLMIFLVIAVLVSHGFKGSIDNLWSKLEE